MAVIPDTKGPELRRRELSGGFAVERRGDRRNAFFVVLRDGEFVEGFARLRDARKFVSNQLQLSAGRLVGRWIWSYPPGCSQSDAFVVGETKGTKADTCPRCLDKMREDAALA